MTLPRLSHQECWELLPWHANGTLAPDEAARVDEHLAACAICREEIRACREMAVSLAGAPAAGLDGGAGSGFEGGFESGFEAGAEAEVEAEAEAAVEAGLARVTARIDGSTGAVAARRRPARWPALAATPRPVRWLLAAQAAALVAAILGGTAFRPAGGEPGGPVSGPPAGAAPGTFHTLSDPAPPGPAAGEPRVRVVFADGAAAAAVRDLLLAARARVIDGPTPFGVYTVEALVEGVGRDRGGEPLLARLRDDPAVVFAEPALGTPPPATPGDPAASEPRAEAAP